MFEKGLIFGAFNPPHDGHLERMNLGLRDAKHVSVYIGKRHKKHSLPYSVRSAALHAMISYGDLSHQVSVLGPESKLNSLDVSEYDLFIAGSDFLNQMGNPFEKNHSDFISQFEYIGVSQRISAPLTDDAKTAILRNSSLIIHENNEKGSISSRNIREKYRKGEPVNDLMPSCIIEGIEKYVSVFELE